jgi:cellulose synthase (UDP-forming)
MADLADTAVVLPDQPSSEELEMFLTMMGHFGAQTGYPVLNVTVTAGSAGMSADSGKDYLVMGTVEDQPALKTLDGALPVGVDETGLHIRDTAGFFEHGSGAWWQVQSSDHVQSGQLETAGGLPDALIEGIEWPRGSNRSAVVMVLRDPSVVPSFLTAFLETSQSSDIAHSVSVLRGAQFTSYRIGTDAYRVGEISWLTRLTMVLQEFPWLVAMALVLFCLLLAALIRANLRRSARERLQGNY